MRASMAGSSPGPVTPRLSRPRGHVRAPDRRLDQPVRLGRRHVDLAVVRRSRTGSGRPSSGGGSAATSRPRRPPGAARGSPCRRSRSTPGPTAESWSAKTSRSVDRTSSKPRRSRAGASGRSVHDRGDLRRHEPVVGLRQGREAVAREAGERGSGRLHHDQVRRCPASTVGTVARRDRHATRSASPTVAGERVAARSPIGRPGVLARSRPSTSLDLRLARGSAGRARARTPRSTPSGARPRARRPCSSSCRWRSRAVLSPSVVGRGEVALERDRDRQVADAVRRHVAVDLDEPDRRLAVAVRADARSRGHLRAARAGLVEPIARDRDDVVERPVGSRRRGRLSRAASSTGHQLRPRPAVDEDAEAEPEPRLVGGVQALEVGDRASVVSRS